MKGSYKNTNYFHDGEAINHMVRGRLKECKNTTHQWRKRFEKKLILFIEKKYVNFSYSPFYDDIEVD